MFVFKVFQEMWKLGFETDGFFSLLNDNNGKYFKKKALLQPFLMSQNVLKYKGLNNFWFNMKTLNW